MKINSDNKHSRFQIPILIVFVLLINYLASFLIYRMDLTSEKRFTLTKPTKDLLQKLDNDIYIRVYLDGDDLPIGFKKLRNSVKEMLDEFKIYSKDKIHYDFGAPEKSEDPQEQKKIFNNLAYKGLQAIEIKEKKQTGKKMQLAIVPGALISFKNREIAVNLLKNNTSIGAENNLNNSVQAIEYELTNGLRKIIIENPQRIAFTTENGELDRKSTYQFSKTLSEYYFVDRIKIPVNADSLKVYSLIIIAKPILAFDERRKFVLDQYLMNGGKIMFLIDGAKASLDSISGSGTTIALPLFISLDDQLFRYGIRINPILIRDLNCAPIALTVNSPNGQPSLKPFPNFYCPILISKVKHPITNYINAIKTEFISSIDTVGENSELSKKILLVTSKFTQKERLPAQINIAEFTKPIDETLYNHDPVAVAALVEGKFTSVFQNRMVNNFTNNLPSVKYKSIATKIMVVADGDIIRNGIAPSGEPYPLGFERSSQKIYAGNKEFLLNAVNYLCDDQGLMSIRSREIKLRLLDKSKIQDESAYWQAINTVLPTLLILVLGIGVFYYRKIKYSKL